jgi:hypothetical protein
MLRKSNKMFINNRFKKIISIASLLSTIFVCNTAIAEEEQSTNLAFPDTWMVRLGAYFVDGADTQFSVASNFLIGTVIDYSRDLGGESRATIPRIDAYYRFNERHRIDFTSFSIDRTGTRTLDIDPPVVINGEDFSGGTINSDINYRLYKVGYAYSFYHSSQVELSLSAGLDITTYDLKFDNGNGNKAETSGFTAPLPMFGLRMGYAITPKWAVHYVAETFFIDFENSVKGALFNYEINTEYRLFKNFAIGGGIARLGSALEINKTDWQGKVSDSYRGYTLFGTFYF